MTMICYGCKTKKELKAAVKALNEGSPISEFAFPRFQDPSIFKPFKGGLSFTLIDLAPGHSITVTDHPKRSWFAIIERTPKGLVVK